MVNALKDCVILTGNDLEIAIDLCPDLTRDELFSKFTDDFQISE